MGSDHEGKNKPIEPPHMSEGVAAAVNEDIICKGRDASWQAVIRLRRRIDRGALRGGLHSLEWWLNIIGDTSASTFRVSHLSASHGARFVREGGRRRGGGEVRLGPRSIELKVRSRGTCLIRGGLEKIKPSKIFGGVRTLFRLSPTKSVAIHTIYEVVFDFFGGIRRAFGNGNPFPEGVIVDITLPRANWDFSFTLPKIEIVLEIPLGFDLSMSVSQRLRDRSHALRFTRAASVAPDLVVRIRTGGLTHITSIRA